ncbi:succinate dehydrogenase assembly factor 2 [Parvularcula dongshanensis]|uniref:FAD assembly factor SdhE n=1 Tax=Parvularcula dongshanensis TaxID=1173995 RepID=A0A840I0K8_9PROT|nr:succinate dehydrogenase assembly factor 2 [Parvularcula dongshanensis]MBB4657718.1 antitoxin CptB [Parvularcula dongshanensis]
MTETLSPEKRRLLYRAMHRGFKEADIVVGKFAQDNLAGMTESETEEFARLLEVPDQDLYVWIIRGEGVPENYRGPVLARMQAFDVAGAMPRR